MKNKVYGYARISTMKQNIQRQLDNIKSKYPDATIISEEYTGTTTDRPKLNKLLKNIKEGDTIIFDEVSRMSRNADEGVKLYEELFNKGINLIFIKEPHINTSVYRDKLNKQIDKLTSTGSKATDKLLESIMTALHEYTIDLAKEQIELAFQTAQAEVDFLHKRTSEGVQRAMAEGKQVGRANGAKIETKKSKLKKTEILKLSRDFNGTNTDKEVMKLTGLARNTYYKYKAEIKAAAQ
jgi:DNA invertase Pin-like site-specific DNA recombinase